jgi:hypothetical protein
MATKIQAMVRPAGRPRAARIVAVRANGSAKIECSHLIISNVVRVLDKMPGMGLYVSVYLRRFRGGQLFYVPP